MLRFIFGRYEAFFKGKIKRKREAGLEISSIGRFDTSKAVHVDSEKWQIDRVVFAQCDVITGAAFKMNVCGDPLGGLAIAVTWGLDAVDVAFIEAFVSKFKQMFQKILEGEKQ